MAKKGKRQPAATRNRTVKRYKSGAVFYSAWSPAVTAAAAGAAALGIGVISGASGLQRLPELLGKGVAGGRELLVGAVGFAAMMLAGKNYPTIAKIGMSIGVGGVTAGAFAYGRQDMSTTGSKTFAFLTDMLGMTESGVPISRNEDGTPVVKGNVGGANVRLYQMGRR